MWKAAIKSKDIVGGMLAVKVEFSHDTFGKFIEEFETNQTQPELWITQQVKNKLQHLNNLLSLHESIEIEKEIILSEDIIEIISDKSPKEQYEMDLKRFEKFVSALAKGFTTQENEEFIALKTKLTSNFKTEYLDLF